MKPRVILPCMLEDRESEAPITFVTSEAQSDVHVFVPETFPLALVQHVAQNFSRRVQQPVYVFHDHAREKYRLCPLPGSSAKVVEDLRYGMFVYSCDLSQSKQVRKRPAPTDDPVADVGESRVPRPRNSWILFRQTKNKELRQFYPKISASEMSTIIASMWRDATPDTKAIWQEKAQEEDRLHKEKYPNYQYKARKPSERKARTRYELHKQTKSNTAEIDTEISPAKFLGDVQPMDVSDRF